MSTGHGENLPRLVGIMQRLLAEDGCPWDRDQSFESLRAYVLEEAFEVVEALDRRAPGLIREELGDLLLQIVFVSELARREGWFGPNDVVDGICDKLERRHPHVFGEEKVDDAAHALRSWEKLKKAEKAGRGALDGVPVALPALLRAVRVGEKASSVGYDWPDAFGPREKIREELAELDQALSQGDRAQAEAELGDVLFALASFARKHQLDPEAALRGTLDRFSRRFAHAEGAARTAGRALDSMTPVELDQLWNEAKRSLG